MKQNKKNINKTTSDLAVVGLRVYFDYAYLAITIIAICVFSAIGVQIVKKVIS